MSQNTRIDRAEAIMEAFARRTGLRGGSAGPRRYLWTDAFAVQNYVGLHGLTDRDSHLESAAALVEQVHRTLGRHRSDDQRSGWLSGLAEDEGMAHPTRGGLRIGKPLPERRPGEPYHPEQEWERDGQYFHYLTKWMDALAATAAVTDDARYLGWAVELAEVAWARFSYPAPGGGRRMYWKMSIDLSRPLVPSMGLQDPLDGLVTFLRLQAGTSASRLDRSAALDRAISELRVMCRSLDWLTDDPLGLGGLLVAAADLEHYSDGAPGDGTLLARLLGSAATGVAHLAGTGRLDGPARRRLAFRELGLSLGLKAVPLLRGPGIEGLPGEPDVESALRALQGFEGLARRIDSFWLDPDHQATPGWKSHEDINAVMLATCLVPEGALSRQPGPQERP